MKILRIKLRNLNSLRGEHVVDFTQEPLASCGIFAITGPTGAGKSTLLDAMTLALYGCAARYQNDRNPENMMSRHTADCLAEVIFSVKQISYRAEWQLRRARGKIDGAIQAPTRFLYDSAEKPLNRTGKEFDTEIERLTGLDYNRFLRSVLLAQGEFSRFLKASAEDRAALLESLTGTEIYTDLGKLTHEETGRREKTLESIHAALQHFQLLSEEEIVIKQQTLGQERQAVDEKQVAFQIKQLLWNQAEQRRNTEKSLEILKEQQQDLTTESAQRSEWREKLRLHQLATPFTASLLSYDLSQNHLTQSRQALTQAETEQTAAQQQHARLLHHAIHFSNLLIQTTTKNQQESQKNIAENEAQSKTIKEWLQAHDHWSELPNAISSLSEKAHHLHKLHTLQRDTQTQQNQQQGDLQKWQQNQQLAVKAEQQNQATLAQKKTNRDDAAQLLKNLHATHSPIPFEELRAHWQQQERHLQEWLQTATQIEQLHEKVTASGTQQQQTQETYALRVRTTEQSNAALAECEKQWRLRLDHWNRTERLASYEDQRALLLDGEPCPLCGAKEHPLAHGNHTSPELNEIRQEMERADTAFQQAKETQTRNQAVMLQAEAQAQAARQLFVDLKDQLSAQQSAWQNETKVAGFENPDRTTFQQAIDRIAQQQQQLTEISRNEQQAQKEFDAAHSLWQQAQQRVLDLKEHGATLQQAQQRLHDAAQERQQVIVELHESLAPLVALYQLTLPDFAADNFSLSTWEKAATQYLRGEQKLADLTHQRENFQSDWQRLNDELTTQKALQSQWLEESKVFTESTDDSPPPAWKNLRDAEIACQQSQRLIEQSLTTRTLRQQQTEQAKLAWEDCEQPLLTHLKDTSFASINAVRQALLTQEEEQRISAWHQDWLRRQQESQIALAQRTQEWQALIDANAPDHETCLRLEEEMQQLKQHINSLQQQITLGEDAIRRDAQQRADYQRKSVEVAAQLNELETWKTMRALIGSYDGAKFRKFAQGISLDILIHHANVHLRNLSDRYRLQRQADAELTLEIIDLYQANSCRPMASLSGGESFIVSLALALGLSDLAGRNVQIDSLFIDEGFGTLDADALDTALSTLESLHQQNKTIGIISHIDLLKERIRTKINIRKLSAGSSTVEVA